MNRKQQRGSALLYMMLIFVAASVVAAGMLSRHGDAVTRTAQFLNQEQAMQYAYGAESYARQLLFDDMQNHGEADYAGEAWGGQQTPFAIPGGSITMQIEDVQGRFNVNSLIADPQAAERFVKLCKSFGISEDTAQALAAKLQALAPPEPSGSTAPPPVAWLVDASEIIDYGFPADSYRKLAPYIVALPSKSGMININSASDFVLAAYLPDNVDASSIHDAMKQSGYIDKDALGKLGLPADTVGVTSDFFRMHATVTLEGQTLSLSSTIIRRRTKQSGVAVIARTWNE